jgi:hypothetical protein
MLQDLDVTFLIYAENIASAVDTNNGFIGTALPSA